VAGSRTAGPRGGGRLTVTDAQKRAAFRDILAAPSGSLAAGAPDALFAHLVQDSGFRLAHLAGNAFHKSLGLPDRGLVGMAEVAERTRQISDTIRIPLLVDGESGYGGTEHVTRAVRLLERAGASGIRFEDSLVGQGGYGQSRAGGVTPLPAMLDKVRAAADARADASLVLVVRCDARPVESLAGVEERLAAYAEAGADAVGVQLTELEDFQRIGKAPPAPLVTLWPRDLLNAYDFLALGYQVGLVTSSAMLAGLAGARALLRAVRESGDERAHLASVPDFPQIRQWYSALGSGEEPAL
jgi:2-methylisocitrate lyase-like PEP mutase family enzyme